MKSAPYTNEQIGKAEAESEAGGEEGGEAEKL